MSIKGSLRLALLLALSAALTPPSFASISHPGQWTNAIRWKKPGGYGYQPAAVHLALLAKPDTLNGTAARIVWWLDDHEHDAYGAAAAGGLWDWSVGNDSLINSGAFPDTSLASGTLRPFSFGDPGYNIFCTGLTPLDEDQGYGRLLVAGGTFEAENGSTEASIYDSRTNSWSETANELHVGRWYPTLTMLSDGKALVSSGSRYGEMWLFGGGASNDSTVYRNPLSHDASNLWNANTVPQPDASTVASRPIPRRGHTATWEIGGTEAVFGGQKLSNGDILDDFWMLRRGDNPDQADYKYNWEKRSPASGAGPGFHAYHTAAVLGLGTALRRTESLILVGGQKLSSGEDAARDDVWGGRLINNSWTIDWVKLERDTSSYDFPARFGHAQVWEPSLHRLFVYGGVGAPGELPNDSTVYSLEFVGGDANTLMDSTTVRWRKCTVLNPLEAPYPRAFTANSAITRRVQLSPSENRDITGLVLYGGRTSQDVVSDSMFVLWPVSEDEVRWYRVPQTGTHPAVEYASGTAAENLQEFWLLGGLDSDSTAQSAMYSAELECDLVQTNNLVAEWTTRTSASHAVWGHTFPKTTDELFSRTVELYDPATNEFTELSGAYRREDWYPHTFTIPGQPTKAFVSGPQDTSWVLTTSGGSSGSWSNVSSATSSIRGGSSVMYRPGKIMKCGSRDTDGHGTAVGTTLKLDATAGSPSWSAAGTMLGRVNHNLTLLPNGTVLVTGGTGGIDNQQNLTPRRQPEIWDPDANSGAGAWDGGPGSTVELDTSTVARGYHSTALLLPDGRVMCGGGNATDKSGALYYQDQYRMDIYSPPYLFDAEAGIGATRPDLRAVPRRVSYGQEFVVTVAGSDIISSGCLIRPGAVTHGYDANQRYVPLAFSLAATTGGSRYYRTSAPTDSAVAPPGDYMLFVLNSAGTPGIARWVHIGRTNGGSGQPSVVSDLGRSCVEGYDVALRWTPPGADVGDVVLSRVAEYKLKYKTSAMNTLSAFNAATDSIMISDAGEPLSGTDRHTISGLTANQTYYFRLRSRNHASGSGNWSDMSNQFSYFVHDEDCGGSGGGGGGCCLEDGLSAPAGGLAFATYGEPAAAPAETTYLENTLFPNVAVGTTRRDRIRLPYGPLSTGDVARVRLSRSGARPTRFDQVKLLAVDHDAETHVALRDGELVAGATHAVSRIVHVDGRDLTEQFLAGGFEGREGDTLFVEFSHEGPGSLMLTTSRAHLVHAPDRTGIDLACESAQGWTAIGHHDVRALSGDEVFDSPSLRRVRLAFLGVHHLEAVARFTPSGTPEVTAFLPSAAEHSQIGDVSASLAENEGATLADGDRMFVDFATKPSAGAATREWYLEVTGALLAGGSVGLQSVRTAEETEGVPAVFALARNRPNPFAGSTTIGFDVPRRTPVRLEIFDVLGRRVVTLADRVYEPGRFTITWDGRTSAGTSARAGVYLCRMSAGAFRAQRHLVLIR